MIIKKFRVKNYKSIIDSGDCYLSEGITIFAGKNESGKTSILEALEDFDTGSKIRESAKPIKRPDSIPEVSITFEVDTQTIAALLEVAGVQKAVPASVSLEIIKAFPDNYAFEPESFEKSGLSYRPEIFSSQSTIQTVWKQLKRQLTSHGQIDAERFDFDFLDFAKDLNSFAAFEAAMKVSLGKPENHDISADVTSATNKIRTEVDKILKLQNLENTFLDRLTKTYVPNFILFNSFDDIFPNKIPFSELETSDWISDLAVISDLDVSTITSSTDRQRHKHKKDLNITLNANYEKFWTQDLSKLSVDWDSVNLYFWIEEDGDPYEPSLRSKGRQWHLAFYIKVSARAKEDVPNIILIDKPGLFLHAKAQKDILAILEDSATKSQLIFSTHSPYLLEAAKLNRVRLVHRTSSGGTKIENKVHALADKETLTPILTAIGLELNSDIASTNKINNVVVEGPSDVYYLNAFKILLKKDSVNFIFGGGAGNMPIVGTILHGWGSKVVYLYDNDQGKKDAEKNSRKAWFIADDLVMSISDTAGSIEDFFAPEDFRLYVAKEKSATNKETNSGYVKRTRADKVLIAKKFLESVQSGQVSKLSQGTLQNATKVFDALELKFRENPPGKLDGPSATSKGN